MYKREILKSSKELTPKEKLELRLTNELTPIVENFDKLPELHIDYFAVCQIVNDNSDSKEYTQVFIKDKDGTIYTSGSESLIERLYDLYSAANEEGIDFVVQLVQKDSKNRQGAKFLSANLVI